MCTIFAPDNHHNFEPFYRRVTAVAEVLPGSLGCCGWGVYWYRPLVCLHVSILAKMWSVERAAQRRLLMND